MEISGVFLGAPGVLPRGFQKEGGVGLKLVLEWLKVFQMRYKRFKKRFQRDSGSSGSPAHLGTPETIMESSEL